MQLIDPLRTTDGLSTGGLYKKWPWMDADRQRLMGDLVLKMDYSIQDFNDTIADGFSGFRKDVVYLIVLATWIKDAYWGIKSGCLREDVALGFKFSELNKLEVCRDYLAAVRSMVVAHPLNSTNHGDYGFGAEGRICVDIRGRSLLDSFPGAIIRRVSFDGVVDAGSVNEDDVVLATFSTATGEEGRLHFERYCLNMHDVRDAAEMYIDALYELDGYLKRQRKRDFE